MNVDLRQRAPAALSLTRAACLPQLLALASGLVVAGAAGVAQADVVTDMNAVVSSPPVAPRFGGPQQQSRAIAMIQIAVHDALNAIDRRYETYSVVPTAGANASPDAAIAAATRRVALALIDPLPPSADKTAAIDAVNNAFNGVLGAMPYDASELAGIAAGDAAANAILANRINDGSATPNTPYVLAPGRGVYQPTPNPEFPAQIVPAFGLWGLVKPFAVHDAQQFRAAPSEILDVTSSKYARDYNEVKSIGDALVRGAAPDSARSDIARFWPGGGSNWNLSARTIVAGRGLSRWQHAPLVRTAQHGGERRPGDHDGRQVRLQLLASRYRDSLGERWQREDHEQCDVAAVPGDAALPRLPVRVADGDRCIDRGAAALLRYRRHCVLAELRGAARAVAGPARGPAGKDHHPQLRFAVAGGAGGHQRARLRWHPLPLRLRRRRTHRHPGRSLRLPAHPAAGEVIQRAADASPGRVRRIRCPPWPMAEGGRVVPSVRPLPAGPGMSKFQTTRWSLITAARDSPEQARAALEQMCRAYRPPVLAFVQRSGYASGDAEDLTQAFFLRFIERGWYAVADPHRGRFRTLMLVALRNFLHDQHAEASALRRGALHRADVDAIDDLPGEESPEQAFTHAWMGTVLGHAMHRLEREWIAAGKQGQFEQLAPLLLEPAEASELRELAAATGVRSNTLAVQAHRMRQRLRQLVRLELLQTVGSAEALEQELAELREAIEAPSHAKRRRHRERRYARIRSAQQLVAESRAGPRGLRRQHVWSVACLVGLGHEAMAHALAHGERLDLDLDDPAQREFGDYELLELIGQGGMGVVYRARQRGLDREVAIKLLSAGHWASEEFVDSLRREAQHAARLQHPNIVVVHEMGEHAGLVYYAMQLVRGQSLSQKLDAEGPLPPREAARLLRTVAEAVDYAHRLGVLHLDLKPGNLLIDTDGVPLVADFGLARSLDQAPRRANASPARPSYMAPEQAQCTDHAALSPATDVWALGAVLYEMLTGQPPFEAEDPARTLQLLQEGDVRKPIATGAGAGRPGGDLPEVPAQGARGALSECTRTGRRPRALSRRTRRSVRDRSTGCNASRAGREREPKLAASAAFACIALLVGVVATTVQWRRAEGNALQAGRALGAQRALALQQAHAMGRDFDALPGAGRQPACRRKRRRHRGGRAGAPAARPQPRGVSAVDRSLRPAAKSRQPGAEPGWASAGRRHGRNRRSHALRHGQWPRALAHVACQRNPRSSAPATSPAPCDACTSHPMDATWSSATGGRRR